MRKEKMITRTFKVTNCSIMAIDIVDNNKIFNFSDTFNGHIREKELLQKCRDKWETKSLKILAVSEIEYTDQLRGMAESSFLAYSIVLPPRTGKNEEENEEV